jgi:hypothetical protein
MKKTEDETEDGTEDRHDGADSDAEVIRTPIAKILNNDAGKPVG